MSRSWLWVACVCAPLLSCTDSETPLSPSDADLSRATPRATLAGPAGAHFLPPLGPAASGPTVSDPGLLDYLVIEARACSDGACEDVVATFTAGDAGAARLRLDSGAGHYAVNWKTAGLEAGSYSLVARVAGTVVARAGVELVGSGRVARGRFRLGSTVPLRLFVPAGAVHVIGPSGGVVEAGPVRLDFPAGAVSDPIGVTVASVLGLPAPTGGLLIGGTTFDFGPDGASFAENVRLTVRYDEGALDGASESSLRLARWGAAGWGEVPGSSVDPAANTVAGALSGFSTYGVISYVDGVPTLSGWGTAAIDGAIAAGEWSSAGRVEIEIPLPEGGTAPGTLYAMNDLDSVYLALVYYRASAGHGEWVGAGFDDDNDGLPDPGEDALGFEPPGYSEDFYRSSACGDIYCGDTDNGGTIDGRGAFVNHGSYAVFELAKPLDSGDPHDLSVAPGDTIGFFFVLFLEDASQNDANAWRMFWPGLDDFARLVLQPGPLPVLSGSGTAALDSVFGTAEYANAACVFFEANQPDGTTTPAQACVMNDATDLYVAVLYAPVSTATTASLAVHLDASGSGDIGGGDDLWSVDPWPFGFADQAWSDDPTICTGGTPCHFLDTAYGGSHDGHGIYYREVLSDPYEIFELRHPLNSLDSWDMALASGGTIGVRIMLLIGDGAGNHAQTWLGDPDLLQIKAK